MSPLRTISLSALAMLAFAGNSLLCRAALKHTAIDAASFTTVRLVSGALMLALLARMRSNPVRGGNALSALALFAYAAAFSFSYIDLSAATGALLLFGAVQVTMIGHGVWNGERPSAAQTAGILLAIGGLVWLLLPGLMAPPLQSALLMLAAGVAWGIYSLRGRGVSDPIATTTGNFLRAAPLSLLLSLLLLRSSVPDPTGYIYAIASGAMASGIGYVIWYTVLPALRATTAATVQLSVPVIAALGGIVLLGEPLTARLAFAALAVLGGIALVILKR